MPDSSLQLLQMAGEGAVLVRRGRVVFANADARAALGANCVGKRVAELFGEEVSGGQSRAFLAQICLGNHPYLLRVAQLEGEQIFFLRPQEKLPAVLNQPFLYALRSTLMNMTLASEKLREEAERLQNSLLLEKLSAVTRSQFQIRRMINNASLILSLAEGSAVCAPQVFSLGALCASVVEAAGALLPQIRFSCSCSGELPIRADPRLVKELLINLLSNAVRHAKGCTRVSVSLLEARQSVVLAVDDDGCGIPAEELPLVFDRYRHSFELSRMGEGPGLGLTAVRLIAQLHGGTLLLESREGRGTTLRVSLHRDTTEQLRAPQDEDAPLCQTRDLLTGFADSLPLRCFREQYLD